MVRALHVDDTHAARSSRRASGGIRRRWPLLVAVFRHEAAVPYGTTVDAAYASPLVQYGIADEVLTLLRDVSIFS